MGWPFLFFGSALTTTCPERCPLIVMWIDPSSSSQNPISVETALPFSLSLITGSPLTSLHPYTLQQCLEASKALDDVLGLFLKYHDPIGEPLLSAAAPEMLRIRRLLSRYRQW